MEIQIKIDATPAAVTCAESLGLLGAGLNALSKIQLKEPQSSGESASVPTVEEPAPVVAEPTPEPAPAPVMEEPAPAAELHTHADILTICAALKHDYPEAFTPAAGLQFTRDACKAAGVDSIKPADPEAVERLYQAVAKMAADFRALQGGAANG